MKNPAAAKGDTRIIAAIRERRCLRFVYHGKERLVEPQTYGLSTTGKEVLRALQKSGGSASAPSRMAKLFMVEKIAELELIDQTFSQALTTHNPADSAMTKVFATLPKPGQKPSGLKKMGKRFGAEPS